MNKVPFFFVALFFTASAEFSTAGDKLPLPKLIERDFYKDKDTFPVYFSGPGQILQIIVTRKLVRDENFLKLKVETTGDAIEAIAVVQIQERLNVTTGTPGYDVSAYRTLSCLLKTKQVGAASVKVTPMFSGGKQGEPREWKIQVGMKAADKDAKPPAGSEK